MLTVKFCLMCCAILGIVDATALSIQASPLRNNRSTEGILIPSGTFPGYEASSIRSKSPQIAPGARNATFNNFTAVTNAPPSSACCFVVQDRIDVRYWADNLTRTTVVSTRVTSLITFATQYIDTIVTTNVSTVTKSVNYTSTAVIPGLPTIPNTNNEAPRPSLMQIGLHGSLATTLGTTITSPTQYYVFPSVKVIHVPAVSNEHGRPVCTTTSTYRATCPAQTYEKWNLTAGSLDSYTEAAEAKGALYLTGINSNAERYFNLRPSQGPAMTEGNLNVVPISFSKPFVYAPLTDQFPSEVVNENLGYVPQSLIEWIAQEPDYVSKFPHIASCLPAGPSVDLFSYFCPPPAPRRGNQFLGYLHIASGLTDSSTVTVAGKGCFHPGACPAPATPGATAVAATPAVTPGAENAQTQDKSSPAGPKEASPPQAPSAAETSGNTPRVSPDTKAANPAPKPLPNPPSESPPDVAYESPSAPTDSSGNPLGDSPEDSHGANPPPNNRAGSPSNLQGLGAIIASAIGFTPTSPPQSEDIKPNPGPTPIASYSISIAPSASAVVINGATSVFPASRPEGRVAAGIKPIPVGSDQISQNAASQYVVAGQTITPGAPPITVRGTKVSLAPSTDAIVIDGSTITLSPISVPGFTVGAEIVSANSASQYVAGGQTLVPGGPAVTVSGTRISLAPSATQVVVGSSTIGLAPTITPPLPAPLTLGSQTYTANANSEYIIAGQTLAPGGLAVTVSGTRLSLAPSATQVVVGSSTIRLAPNITPLLPALLTFDSQTYTADSNSEYTIAGQTLIQGAPAITVSGTPISLAPGASQVVIGSSTINLAPTTPLPLLTLGSQIFTANSLSDYILDGQTLIPGAPAITVSNTAISLAPDASEAIIGGSTELLHPAPTLPALIIGSQTFTANNAGAYVIGSQTLTPGSSGIVVPGSLLTPGGSVFTVAGQVFTANPTAFLIDGTTISAGGPGVTISGTPVRLEASGVLDVGNSSVTLSDAKSTNGLGGPAAFTGGGDRMALGGLYSVLALGCGVLVVAVL